jgi:DNA-binding CsgD family transcriptional regulator
MPEVRAAAISFAEELPTCSSPADLLNALDRAASALPGERLNVLGAFHTPRRRYNIESWSLNDNIFYHESVRPADLWREYSAGARDHGGPSVLVRTAWLNEGPFTVTECMRKTEPTGEDRWVFDLMSRFSIRDGYYCPVNKWTIVFWSRRILELSQEGRGLLHFMAVEAAGRLAEMASPDKTTRADPNLTGRELGVLYRLSRGDRVEDIAAAMGLATPTIETYIERAKKKLDAKTRTHAVAKAMRRMLMK